MRILFLLFILLFNVYCKAQPILHADGKRIVAGDKEVLLRGIGLGGWMLQEPYMLKLSGTATAQYDIRKKIVQLIGEKKTNSFYASWLQNHCTKADIDSLAAWGFNSVRLPMHYNLFTLPVEKEPVKGKQTWLKKGFELTDSLLQWCSAAHIYLILDLHAAPGGQGNDNAIADRDPSLPSLWQSDANIKKTIALWEQLASRYKNEPWIGGYDLINEPNWGFKKDGNKNGCDEKENRELVKVLKEITAAIRKIDTHHIIFTEGNCWANNYEGMLPLWDNNMVISFHKYWNYNDKASIQKFLDYRERYNVPLWLGETGENSNAWFVDLISLVEKYNIGWAMWPMKKSGMNNLLQVVINPEAQQVFDFWNGKAQRPSAEFAFNALMKYAANTNISNNIARKDVINAISRSQAGPMPYKANLLSGDDIIYAADYDLGISGVAYHDTDSAEYWVSANVRTPWNTGGHYRNDGVDIEQCHDEVTNGYNIGWTLPGEWTQYTLYSPENTAYDINIRSAAENKQGELQLLVNNIAAARLSIPVTGGNQKWTTSVIKNVQLQKGWNNIRMLTAVGGFNLNYLQFIKNSNTASN